MEERLTRHQAYGRYGVMSMKKLLRKYVVRPLGLQSSYVRYLDLSIPFRLCKLIPGERRSYLLRAIYQLPPLLHLRYVAFGPLGASLRSALVTYLRLSLIPLLHDIHIEITHFLLSLIPPLVTR
jgi:hypothetical protein